MKGSRRAAAAPTAKDDTVSMTAPTSNDDAASPTAAITRAAGATSPAATTSPASSASPAATTRSARAASPAAMNNAGAALMAAVTKVRNAVVTDTEPNRTASARRSTRSTRVTRSSGVNAKKAAAVASTNKMPAARTQGNATASVLGGAMGNVLSAETQSTGINNAGLSPDVWRQLSRNGWKRRKATPRRLKPVFVAPGKSGRLSKLTLGIDYFEGEEELIAYLDAAEANVAATSAVHSTILPAAARRNKGNDDEELLDDSLSAFDRHNFLEAMRTQELFHPVSDDDINLCPENLDRGYGSEEVLSECSDEEMEFPEPMCYVDDVDSSDSEDDNADVIFDVSDDALRNIATEGWEIYDEQHSDQLRLNAPTDYYSGSWGPTMSAAAFGDSPLGLFFYFLPKALWVRIADETNRYRRQSVPPLAEEKRNTLLRAQQRDPCVSVPTLADIEAGLRRYDQVRPHELVHVIGLLIARSLCPMRDGVAKHWSSTEDGAVPRGTWGRYMKRARYEEIIRFIHFNDNESPDALHDKAWKIRPVLQAIETTFRRGFRLGTGISFDEGMVPNKSKLNPLKVYNKDKPSKWGTKFYLTCCSTTAYCARKVKEIYDVCLYRCD